MNALTTQGITVRVDAFYQFGESRPIDSSYIFAYRVKITNNSPYVVKLLSRYWEVKNALSEIHTVEGEGVIGQQPTLRPGEEHVYMSWTPLETAMGWMKGYYVMETQEEFRRFKVQIPEFHLLAPPILN